MPGRGQSEAPLRVMGYCIVPRDLATKLHDLLRRHFQDDPGLEVVVDHRRSERRRVEERRESHDRGEATPTDRRRIRNFDGRRIDERRVTLVQTAVPVLPRKAHAHVDRLVFVERLEPPTQQREDVDSARLVTRFQRGDTDEFATLYLRYFDRVYNYLRVALGDPHSAEEVTQQVFAKVFEALPRYERRAGKLFRAWLFIIVRNEALTELHKRRRIEPMEDDELHERRHLAGDDDEFVNALDWVSDRDLVLLIERLPLPQRQVLMLRYMLDLDSRRIAEILDRSPEDVRILQHRALRFLEQRLTALGRAPRTGHRSAKMRGWRKQYGVIRARRFALR